LNEPELVILDEPSLGLDPVGMVEVRELVKEVAKEGVTVFLSSHLLFEVEQICSHVTIIHRGVSVASDTIENVSNTLSGPTVLEVEVAELSDAIVGSVKELPFVSNVSQENKRLIIKLKSRDDVRSQVSQAITKAGGIIVSMNLKGRTLEEAFMRLVTKS